MEKVNNFVLDNVLNRAKACLASKQTCTFIFDLDSTLFCVSPRTEKILKNFANQNHIKTKYPDAAHKMRSLSATPNDWGIKTILNRHDIKETLGFFEAVREYWIEQFFSNHHLNEDTPYPGAIEFVKYASDLGIEIQYLTGRDRIRMETGTLTSLAQYGLPLKKSSFLNMKPDKSYDDSDYKVDFFKHYSGDLSHCWFFENEPFIIHQVKRTVPELNIIFMNSVHSGRANPPPEIPHIHFEWNFTRD
ncbi:MAG: hypothetical protein KDD34_02290 [Bdellovibrionales bacterium]|nr:hypothetical protein [Bdellovibrionales bacterium]